MSLILKNKKNTSFPNDSMVGTGRYLPIVSYRTGTVPYLINFTITILTLIGDTVLQTLNSENFGGKGSCTIIPLTDAS